MLSARSGGKVYVAGDIPNPTSREYHCLHCDERVSYVPEKLNSGRILISEHFRHPKGSRHIERNLDVHQMLAVRGLVAQLAESYCHTVATDQILDYNGKQIPVDLIITERDVDAEPKRTVVQVESRRVKWRDVTRLRQATRASGMYLLPVLCAQDDTHHPSGRFFRKQVRARHREEPLTVAVIKGNERTLVESMGFGAYYSFEDELLHKVAFGEYAEILRSDIYNDLHELVARRGETREYAEFKRIREDVALARPRFAYTRNSHNDLIAVPRPACFGDALQAERLARADGDKDSFERFAECIALYLERASPRRRADLTRKYGPEALGPYANLDHRVDP